MQSERTLRGGAYSQPMLIPAAILAALLTSVSLLILEHSNHLLTIFFSVVFILLLIFYFYPLAGIYTWTLLFPIQSIFLEITIGWRKHKFYAFEALVFLVLPVLLVQVLSRRHSTTLKRSRSISVEFSWIYLFSVAFIAWAILCFSLSNLPGEAVISLAKLINNFVFCALIITHLDRYERFIKLIIFFCVFAAFLSVIVFIANHYGLDLSYKIITPGAVSVNFFANFINTSGVFDPKMVGMTFSSGLSGRHELGIFLSCATVFSALLIKKFKAPHIRAIFVFFILLYANAQFVSVSKGSLLGLFASSVFLFLIIPEFRRYILLLMIAIFGLWSAAAVISDLIKPEWVKDAGIATSVGNLANQSALRPGTVASRFKLMREAIDVFLSSRGMGGGPDSLLFLKTQVVHGHNFLLTYAADYGIPGVLFAGSMVVLLARLGYKEIVTKARIDNPVWLLRLTIFAALLMTLFEYSLDVNIWYPHVWFIGALFLASLRIEEPEPESDLAVI